MRWTAERRPAAMAFILITLFIDILGIGIVMWAIALGLLRTAI